MRTISDRPFHSPSQEPGRGMGSASLCYLNRNRNLLYSTSTLIEKTLPKARYGEQDVKFEFVLQLTRRRVASYGKALLGLPIQGNM